MIVYNGNIVVNNGRWIIPPNPLNPLHLPPNTIRVRTSDGNVPDGLPPRYDTATLVPGTTDVYDVYKSGTSFKQLFIWSNNVVEVLGANTSNVTDMDGMFCYCGSLQSVSLFDTSKVTNMNSMFELCTALQSIPLFDTSKVTNMNRMLNRCSSLTNVPLFDTSNVTSMKYMFDECTTLSSVPLFDTSKVTNMQGMFQDCNNVQSGALALYQQASTQTNPPSNHSFTFTNCGSNTQTGAAELSQIPRSWGGTGA